MKLGEKIDLNLDLSTTHDWWVEIGQLSPSRLQPEQSYWLWIPEARQQLNKVIYWKQGGGKNFTRVKDNHGNWYEITHIWMGMGMPERGPEGQSYAHH